MRSLITLVFILTIQAATAQHPNAHAHNDYEHAEPMFDALRSGFTSLEADVHLVDDQLLVAHNRPTSSSKTLETLYLQPISVLIDEQGGLYPDYSGDFFLMLDIKTDAEKTYVAIERLLQNYLHIMDTPLGEQDDHHPLKVFLSGNRPIQTIIESERPVVGLDGRPDDLTDNISSLIMPVVSINYSKYNPFTVGGKVNKDKELKLRNFINTVHDQGKKVRFWAHPDNPAMWEYLLSMGVDLINSDKLEELDAFLTKNNL